MIFIFEVFASECSLILSILTQQQQQYYNYYYYQQQQYQQQQQCSVLKQNIRIPNRLIRQKSLYFGRFQIICHLPVQFTLIHDTRYRTYDIYLNIFSYLLHKFNQTPVIIVQRKNSRHYKQSAWLNSVYLYQKSQKLMRSATRFTHKKPLAQKTSKQTNKQTNKQTEV